MGAQTRESIPVSQRCHHNCTSTSTLQSHCRNQGRCRYIAVGNRCSPPPETSRWQLSTDRIWKQITHRRRAKVQYGHIEKEALAIVYGCEHFHMYLYGRRFELETDHRPLEHIYKAKPQNKLTSARLERWRIRLQEYDFNVIYRPDTSNLADPLSRLPKNAKPGNRRSNMEACADRYVHYMTKAQTPRAMQLEEIQKATLEDPELKKVKQCLQNNKLHQLPR